MAILVCADAVFKQFHSYQTSKVTNDPNKIIPGQKYAPQCFPFPMFMHVL